MDNFDFGSSQIDLINDYIDKKNKEKIKKIKKLENNMFDKSSMYGFEEARRQIINLIK